MKYIGIDGQWVLGFSEPLESLTPLDLLEFMLISEAGNTVPSARLKLKLADKEVFHKLNQGRVITCSFGPTMNNLGTVNLTVFSRKKLGEFDQRVMVEVILTLTSGVKYSMETETWIEKNKKSIELIQSIAGKHFSVQSTVQSTNDSMNWICSNYSGRRMINSLWLHSNLPNQTDVMTIGITPEDKFLVRTISDIVSGKVGKFAFVTNPEYPANGYKKFIYVHSPIHLSNTGTVDYLSGYSQTRIVHNQDNKESNYQSAQGAPSIAQTSKDESVNVARRFSTVSSHLSSNQHNSWFDRQDYNIRSLTKMNSHIVKVMVEGQFVDCDVTDLALLYDATTDTVGHWIIKKVCHKVTSNNYYCIVTLCRDNPNEVK